MAPQPSLREDDTMMHPLGNALLKYHRASTSLRYVTKECVNEGIYTVLIAACTKI